MTATLTAAALGEPRATFPRTYSLVRVSLFRSITIFFQYFWLKSSEGGNIL